ncbi:H-type lectin domain-containing protein [Roseicyclus sp.]
MKRLSHHLIGAEQGSLVLFSDFEDNGPMWTGEGPREVRRTVQFSEAFRAAPMVTVGISMWDTGGDTNQRADLQAEAVTAERFELVFRTWGDSRVARIRADWMALGELAGGDDWQLY